MCVGGGWAVDALLGRQTRPHSDLDLWVEATDCEALLAGLSEQGVDRIHPWPGDRPWNFVVHDRVARRVDLHFFEAIGDGQLHYGSLAAPFRFAEPDLTGIGTIGGSEVRCERPEFAIQCRTGYPPREVDRHDVAALCDRFGIAAPVEYQ